MLPYCAFSPVFPKGPALLSVQCPPADALQAPRAAREDHASRLADFALRAEHSIVMFAPRYKADVAEFRIRFTLQILSCVFAAYWFPPCLDSSR